MGESSQFPASNDPSSNLREEIRALRAELEAKILQYNEIIVSQANELRILRDILCISCKWKFAEAIITPRSSSVQTSGSSSLQASDRQLTSRQTVKKIGPSSPKNASPSIRPASTASVVGPARTGLSSVDSKLPASSPSKSPVPRKPTSSKLDPFHSRRTGTTNDLLSSNSARTGNRGRDLESSQSITLTPNTKGSTTAVLRTHTSKTNPLSKPPPASSKSISDRSLPTRKHVASENISTSSSDTTPPAMHPSTPSSEPFTFTLISPPSGPPESFNDHSDSAPSWSLTHSSGAQTSTFPPDSSPPERLETHNDNRDSESPWSVTLSPHAKHVHDVTFERTLPHNDRVNCVKFNMDGKYLAVGLSGGAFNTWHGKVIIYSTKTGMERRRLVEYTRGEQSGVNTVCFSPNSNQLAIGYKDGHISLWLIDEKRVRNMFYRHDQLMVTSLAFSPNGRRLVSASLDGTIRIWNVRDGSAKEILVPTGYMDLRVTSSPTGRYVAAGTGDGILCILDSRTQKFVKKWEGHQNDVSSLTFIPNGRGLLSSSFDGTVKHWDVSPLGDMQSTSRRNAMGISVTLLRQFGGHSHIRSIATSADGQWVLCGLDDSSARIWNISNGMQECSLHGHTRRIWSVDTSPVGNYLAMGDIDGRVSLWRVE